MSQLTRVVLSFTHRSNNMHIYVLQCEILRISSIVFFFREETEYDADLSHNCIDFHLTVLSSQW